jgi:hypothetical protein
MLARRRLLQLSVFDLLLATTAAIALLVSYDLRAESAFVYTFGFAGGLVGTAIALNAKQPRWWLVFLLGSLLGIVAGYVGAQVIEALNLRSTSPTWRWRFEKGQPPVVTLAIPYGLAGGVIASILSTALHVFRSWIREARQRAGLDESHSPFDEESN